MIGYLIKKDNDMKKENKDMKTLVIHPYDETTIFLNQIYEGKGWTIIDDNMVSKRELKEAIKSHERIVMLGHGTEHGLFGRGRYMIDASYVYLLREKELAVVWCNSDKFIEKYDLKGFYTGMIISESVEARFLMVEHTMDDIDESNVLFTNAISESIDSTDMLSEAKNVYYLENTSNEVINFNKVRFYTR